MRRRAGCSGSSTTAARIAANERSTGWQRDWPNAHLVQLPVHASWLNQVEIYFSVVQRKVLTPNDFTDIDEVQSRLLAFERRYEQTAAPFEWKFTRSDLAKLIERLADKPDYRRAA